MKTKDLRKKIMKGIEKKEESTLKTIVECLCENEKVMDRFSKVLDIHLNKMLRSLTEDLIRDRHS